MQTPSVFRSALFAGQVAIVTGGGTGIGAAIARELASLGARVVVASRNKDRLLAAAQAMNTDAGAAFSHPITAIPCNIRAEEEVRELMQAVVKAHGRISLLVNNGGGQFPSPAAGIGSKGWHAVVETNLTGTFTCCREAYAASMGAHGGAIVNIVADMWKGFPGMAHTGAARAGVVNLTKSLAVEWADRGIRVNAVAPGVVYSKSAADNYEDKNMLAAYAPYVPAKRLGSVEEIASAVCFLMSPGASYITGSTLNVDGGSSLYNGVWPVQDHDKMPVYGTLPDHCRVVAPRPAGASKL